MVSNIPSISFGRPNTNTETGKMSFSPKILDSFDPTEIIDTLKTLKESRLQKKPAADLAKSTAGLKDLSIFKEKLTVYQKSLTALRGMGEGLDQGGVFASTAVQGTSDNPLTQPADLIAFVPADGMTHQSFTLSVQSLARQDRTTATTAVPDRAAPLGWNGTLTLGTTPAIGAARQSPIIVTPDMSLEQVVFLANSAQSDTGVSASIVKIAENDHRLQFQSLGTGEKITISGAIGAGAQLPDQSPFSANDLRSHVVYNGQDIYRASNTITDLAIPFGTLDLKKAEAGTTLTIRMTPNTGDVRDAVDTWMTAHNELQTFINDQKGLNTGDGEKDVKKGPLYNTTALKDGEDILNIFSKSDGTQSIGSLRAAGIIRSDLGIYEFDQAVNNDENLIPFETVLRDRLPDLEKFFAFEWTCDNPQFRPVAHPNQMPPALNGQNITVTFDRDNAGVLSATFTGGGKTVSAVITQTATGAILDGPKGSIFHGVSVLARDCGTLANNTSRTTIINGNQGKADVADRTIKLFLSTKDSYDSVMGETIPPGSFESTIDFLSGLKETATQKLDDIKQRIDHFTETEMKRFQKSFDLYSKLNSLTLLLDQINESKS